MKRPAETWVLFADTADGVWASGATGQILFWNPAAERILGYSAQETIGRPCRDIFCGRDYNGNRLCGWPCPIKMQLGEGEPVQHFDMLTHTNTGEPVWLDVSSLSLPRKRGRPTATVHFFRDTTVAHQIGGLVRNELVRSKLATSVVLPALISKLTSRELQVLELLRAGATTGDIARQFSISRATARNHIQNIFRKLGVHSRIEAVAYANRLTWQKPIAEVQPCALQ